MVNTWTKNFTRERYGMRKSKNDNELKELKRVLEKGMKKSKKAGFKIVSVKVK
jgi:hypothetical protein